MNIFRPMKYQLFTLRCLPWLFLFLLFTAGNMTLGAQNWESAERRILIDKPNMRLYLLSGNDTLRQYPISCGRGYGQKQRRGDMRTPEGDFDIIQIVDASQWGHDFNDGNGYIPHAYGPWFVRLSAGNGIGIHGTHDPASMGLRASEGCIRLRNEDIAELRPLLHLHMPVRILPDRYPRLSSPAVSAHPSYSPKPSAATAPTNSSHLPSSLISY